MDEQFQLWLIGGGLCVGIVFGILAQRSRFCAVSAVSNSSLMRDYRYLDAYIAAILVGLIGTQTLEMTGSVDIGGSAYRRPSINWVGALFGGFIFGIGSMISGGCASRTLIRTAEGNIGAMVTLLAFSLVGMITLFGVLDPVREWTSSSSLYIETGDSSIARIMGLPSYLLPIIVVIIGIAVLYYHLQSQNNWSYIVYGCGIGLCVVISWWLTGVMGQDEFFESPPSSIAVAGPLSRSAVFLTTGEVTGSYFGLFLLVGMLFGAFVSAYISGQLRWVTPAGSMVGSYLLGGAIMGAGAILAGGCNVGQGLSGLSTFSLTSLLAVCGMIFGMWLALRWIKSA